MNPFLRISIITFFLLQLPFFTAFSIQVPDAPSGSIGQSVDIRPVYYYVNTKERDGSKETSHTLNLRGRYGINYHIRKNLTFRVRAAMRLSTNQSDFRFRLNDHTDGNGTYPAGTATVDEFLLRWKVNPSLKLTAGRFQGRFSLEGFIPKGVDRYYASNLAISYTDGIWAEWDVNDRWRTHFIGSHNSSKGSSHTARPPLHFDRSSAARITGFANLQSRKTEGRWAQREFSISVTPQNFERDEKLRNLVALSTRWMYRPGFSVSGEEYLLGGELGFIPVAPRPSEAGLKINDERLLFGGPAVSWQLSAYANHISERHRIGILYGQADPHWLISSSFAPNVVMAEIRYRYTLSEWIHYEFRVRIRDEIHKPSDAAQTRQIFDYYIRFTVSF